MVLFFWKVKANARTLGEELIKRGYDLVTGGTDNHLILWDLRRLDLTGSKLEKLLEAVRFDIFHILFLLQYIHTYIRLISNHDVRCILILYIIFVVLVSVPIKMLFMEMLMQSVLVVFGWVHILFINT